MTNISDDEHLAVFGWPALLTTKRAIAYTGQSRHAIGRAVRDGRLVPVGKRGRSFVFRRIELDAWMCGAANDATDDRPVATVTPIGAARARAPLSESLARIRKAAGRGDER